MAKRYKIMLIAILIILLIAWVAWSNTALETTEYMISSNKLPEDFSGFRIAHVSDLHNTQIGKNNDNLLSVLEDAQPNIIVITGDLIDSRRTDFDVSLEFARCAVEIAPCYFVSGNHEARLPDYNDLQKQLTEIGVVVLDNDVISITYNDAEISLIGLTDPSFKAVSPNEEELLVAETLSKAETNTATFRLLLSHRPEFFPLYVQFGFDLVLSGHVHGGQFRLPIVGGVFAPSQGLFPKYDAGLFQENDTNMIISRGIGNSLFPIRINNRPEVVIVELNTQ